MRLTLLRKSRRTTRLDTREPGPVNQPQEPSTRRYLADTVYLLPKDEQESDRLTFQHHALFQAIGKQYVAPLDPSLRLMLDVGAGTGIWALEMARTFPHALVVGLDVDPSLFREPAPFPPNCLLRRGDVLKGLPFPDGFFQYTHQRLLVYAIPAVRWPDVLRELVRVTRVGGWIEVVEADPSLHNQGPATRQLLAQVEVVQRARGLHPEPIRQLGALFAQAGLQQIDVQTIPLALGEWGGRIGGLLKRDALSVFGALKEPCCQGGAMDTQTFETLLRQMDREWEVSHTSCLCYAVYGKRVHA